MPVHHDDLQAKREQKAYFLDVLQPRANNEAILCVVLLIFIDTKGHHKEQNNCPLLSYKSIKSFKTDHRMYRNNHRRIIISQTCKLGFRSLPAPLLLAGKLLFTEEFQREATVTKLCLQQGYRTVLKNGLAR